MSSFSIQAEGLGKRYFVGENDSQGGRAFSRLFPQFRRNRFQEFWALRDVSFDVEKGEAIGIIGRNGAGKSTLLKVISRITAPAEGRARVRGRMGTLLEVGTGFHAELSGRENVFLSGTILGMSYREVLRKFDEIVAFSEIEKFIDTPVKRYSSGMYVRLAFAVASFLEPEILIVDEVLAVGDAAFQRKSLGRLNEVSAHDGRTVLFVSHNLNAIRTFCKRVLVMDKGHLIFDGRVEEGLEAYLRAIPKELDVSKSGLRDRLNRTSGAVRFRAIKPFNSKGEATWRFQQGETIRIIFDYEVIEPVNDMAFLIRLSSALDGQCITTICKTVSSHPLKTGERGAVEFTLPNIQLRPAEISLYVCLQRIDAVVAYDVVDTNVDLPLISVTSDTVDRYERQGLITLPAIVRGLHMTEGV